MYKAHVKICHYPVLEEIGLRMFNNMQKVIQLINGRAQLILGIA